MLYPFIFPSVHLSIYISLNSNCTCHNMSSDLQLGTILKTVLFTYSFYIWTNYLWYMYVYKLFLRYFNSGPLSQIRSQMF